MSQENRIWFPGNPWPEGHPIEDFQWTAEVHDGVVWFYFHLETADYFSERPIQDEEDEDQTSWEAPIVWGNFHRCTISATYWHKGGFPVCAEDQYSSEFLDGHEASVDPLPLDPDRYLDDLAFLTYTLGHDSVAGHQIKFSRRGASDRFDLHWKGKIALVYSGHYDYDYEFEARIFDVELPTPTEAPPVDEAVPEADHVEIADRPASARPKRWWQFWR